MKRKPITTPTKRDVWDKCSGRCWYCGKKLNPFFFHFDHVEAHSKGGMDSVDNLVLSCMTCNISKGNKSVSEWRFKLMRKYGIAKENELRSHGLPMSDEPYGYDPLVVFFFERHTPRRRLLGDPPVENWVKFKGWSE
jgi:hypothetical protein